jgi:hypothetical protein
MDEKKYNTDYAYVVPAGGAARCYCMRCRGRGLMGPAVLITLGVLFLLSEFGIARFHSTWPILLIVIGLIKVLGPNLDATGHIDVPEPSPAGTPPAATQNSEPRQVDHV